MKITVKCEYCGFSYTLYTNDESIIDELKQCDCGAEAIVAVEKIPEVAYER